jgi:hypothetical protein
MDMSPSRSGSARLVARQVSELLLARGRRWRGLVAQDHLAGVVFDTVLSAGLAHLPLRDADGGWIGVEAAAARGRPVTAAAVAQSMAIPNTTVRRRAAALVADGRFVRDGEGLRIAPGFVADPAWTAVSAANARDLGGTLEALAAAGYAPAVTALARGVAALPAGAVDRALIAFALRALEVTTRFYGDVTGGLLFVAIVGANIRHITADPELARRYAGADTPPPDAERRPVSLRALAAAVELPFETVRRRVGALIAAGLAERRGRGVVVPTAVLTDARHGEHNGRVIGWFERMLDGLGGGGRA